MRNPGILATLGFVCFYAPLMMKLSNVGALLSLADGYLLLMLAVIEDRIRRDVL